MDNISKLSTEQRNQKTVDIDKVNTKEMVKMINEQDKTVALSVEKEIDKITQAIDVGYEVVSNKGRIIYMGAGTSGRLGVLDASEILPTFGEKDLFVGLIAGGEKALINPIENAEDNKEFAIEDLKRVKINNNDLVIGIAASGRTPYVISGLEYAKSIGAKTASISTSKDAIISSISDIGIEVVVGQESLTGSTRMKSGTAQKMVLNILSTGIMIKLGKTYSNLMVDVVSTNAKLDKRAINIISQITNEDLSKAEQVFFDSNKNVKISIVRIMKKVSLIEAQDLLNKNKGKLRKIID